MKSERGKSGRVLIIAICFLFLVSTAQGAWASDDLMYAKGTAEIQLPVHNIDTGEDFENIQAAIDDPDTKDGHTISVDAGIYREPVVINKQIKLIAVNKDRTIIDGDGSGNCIQVTADNVEIRGFRIRNGNYGIYLESSNCRVIGNYITSIDFDGISLRSNSANNTIAQNRLSKVKRRSIDLASSCNNRIHDNDLSGNGDGIFLSSSHNNRLYNNSLTDISNCGLSLAFSKSNIIWDNDLSGSDKGIDLSSSDNNYVFHNNLMDNRIQAKDSRDTNHWDNGPIEGGNYWSDHECTGNPSNGSQPYHISRRGATDKYPFSNRYGWLCTRPAPPTLADPGTNDSDGNYIVSWSSVSSATTYTLEEDTNGSFSSPTIVYSGSGTSKEITDKSDGTYYYRVKACNECGCSEWSNIEDVNIGYITIDTILPTVTISYPTNEQTFRTTTITVNGTASDNMKVSKVEVEVGSGGWQIAAGTTSWSIPVTLASGSNTIYARATDTAGNTNQSFVTVICDIAPPVITHEPISTATKGESIPISATITDSTTEVASATLFYRITGGEEAWTSTPMGHVGNNYSATIPASDVTIAGLEYYIEAVDDASNTAFSPATAPTMPYSITVITKDTIPPNVTISYPTDGQMFRTTNITVNGTASDNVRVSKVEVNVESGSWQIASGTTSWSIPVTLESGSNRIYVRATDRSENTKNTSVTVICDIIPPVITHEPITNATKGEAIHISATITDDITEVASATLFYRIASGEGAWTSTPMIPTGDNYSATIPASDVTIAGLEYYIKAVDAVLNTAFSPATASTMPYSITVITKDTIPPNVTISYPTNGQMFRSTNITVNGTASDNVAVSKVEVKVESGDWQIAAGTTSWSIPVTLESGSNRIYARATDTSGYTKNASVMVICDITPPIITHEPVTSAIEGESIPISASIRDSITEVAYATLSYRITGGEEAWTSTPMDHSGDNYSAIIPASDVTIAGLEYYIEAVDEVSNTAFSPATASTAPYRITVIGKSNITISAVPSTISLSDGVTISGNITPARSAIVTLTFTRPDNSSLEHSITSAISGHYYFLFYPKEEGNWSVNATWTGDSYTAGNTSDNVSFTVRGKSEVTISAVPSIINLSESVNISGNIRPQHSAIVTLTFTTPNGSIRNETFPAANGSYYSVFNPKEAGTWFVDAAWAGDSYTAGNTSKTVSFTVRGESNVTISAVPSTINLSESVNISGKISHTHSAIVTLTFTTPAETVIEETTTSTTKGTYKFDFTPYKKGIWRVNATWAGDSDTAGNISDNVSFTVNRGPVYYAMIIAGRKTNSDHPCFNLTANRVYKKLLTCGFTHKRIFYLNPSMEQDADGDGVYDIDRITSLSDISYAFNTWAQGNVSANDSLLLYMVNPGGTNTFFVNGIDNTTLTATDLDKHLNDFTSATKCHDIVVAYDACYAGSFIDELSGDGRIIITSANITGSALFDNIKGGVFSYYFFNSISAVKTIKEAFEDASFALKNSIPIITPLLDDNGDGSGHAIERSNSGDWVLKTSSGDGSVAKFKYICIRYGISPATITEVIPSQKVVLNTPITIGTVVVNDSSIKDVYARINEPNSSISPTNDSLTNQTTSYLEDPDGNANYTASFTPTKLGNYELTLNATDEEGNKALPKRCIITAVSPSESAIFDTGEETHTYPWKGTGGHSEYEKIWNSTRKGVEAYFLGGEITRQEFMDTKGHLNNKGIPTIKLGEV